MISHHAENLEIGGKDFATASSVTWRVKWAITALFCIFFLWARVWEGIVAAVLNPADSPFERWGKEKQFEEAGLCWSPGSYCTSFLRFHNFFQKHIINTSVMYSTMCFCNSVVLGQKLILKATWDAMQWFSQHFWFLNTLISCAASVQTLYTSYHLICTNLFFCLVKLPCCVSLGAVDDLSIMLKIYGKLVAAKVSQTFPELLVFEASCLESKPSWLQLYLGWVDSNSFWN